MFLNLYNKIRKNLFVITNQNLFPFQQFQLHESILIIVTFLFIPIIFLSPKIKNHKHFII